MRESGVTISRILSERLDGDEGEGGSDVIINYGGSAYTDLQRPFDDFDAKGKGSVDLRVGTRLSGSPRLPHVNLH